MRSIRIFYSKQKRMKFISHLDMNRYITRIVKLANIPARYTEGFHKHLYVTFALPLSLGTTCDYDVIDMKIVDDNFTNEQVREALQKNLVDGIEILSVDEPVMSVSEVTYAEYTLMYKDSSYELLEKLNALFNGNVILTTKKGKKGKVTEVNLAEKIVELKTELAEGFLKVIVMLPAGNTDNINPSLFIQAFCESGNRRPEICTINRNMIYNASKEIFK